MIDEVVMGFRNGNGRAVIGQLASLCLQFKVMYHMVTPASKRHPGATLPILSLREKSSRSVTTLRPPSSTLAHLQTQICSALFSKALDAPPVRPPANGSSPPALQFQLSSSRHNASCRYRRYLPQGDTPPAPDCRRVRLRAGLWIF